MFKIRLRLGITMGVCVQGGLQMWVWTQGQRKFLTNLTILHSSKKQSYPWGGGRRNSVLWLRSPPCRGIQEEGSGYGCLIPHPGVRIRAKGHGRSYLFSMGPTVPVADWRTDSGGVRLHISVQGGLQKWDSIGVLAHSHYRGGLCS